MHDKNGNEVKVGDVVRWRGHNGYDEVGTVMLAYPSSDTCNLAVPVAYVQRASGTTTPEAIYSIVQTQSVTAKYAEIVKTGDDRKLEHGPLAGFANQYQFDESFKESATPV